MTDAPAALLRARVSVRAALLAAQAKADAVDPRDEAEDVIKRGHDRLAALALLLLEDRISRDEFLARAQALLTTAITAGATLGGVRGAEARQIAAQLLSEREDYLAAYADDLAAADIDSGDLDTGISEAQATSRAGIWAGLAWTGLQMARGQAAQGDGDAASVSVTWICKDDAASCDDCTALADGSPYTLDTLPTYPGGDVQCLGNCRCELDYASEREVAE